MTRTRTREYLRRIDHLHVERATFTPETPEWKAATKALMPLYAKVTRRNPALGTTVLAARAEAA